jgi:superfamily II DNA or RNA helicase
VATVQSASRREIKPTSLGLLIADEAHRYGSEVFSRALREEFGRRLALSGSYERQLDDGVERHLTPYFGPVVVDYGYGEALQEKVVAPFRLALVGVKFTPSEQALYDRESKRMNEARDVLTMQHGYPFERRDFFSAVNVTLKEKDSWREDTELCQIYMSAFNERRRLQSEASQKENFVHNLGPALSSLGGTLVFAETIDGAKQLADGLSKHTTVRPLTSDLKPNERADLLRQFAAGRLKAICTPRVLDEGVDVPEAEVAIVVATSKTRRQLIQRMGRVIRLKKDGRAAKLVILYVRETGEDPAQGGHEAFLDAVMPHAEETREFDYSEPAALRAWLPG